MEIPRLSAPGSGTDSSEADEAARWQPLDAWEPALFEAFEDEALCAYWQMIEESDLGYERRFFC